MTDTLDKRTIRRLWRTCTPAGRAAHEREIRRGRPVYDAPLKRVAARHPVVCTACGATFLSRFPQGPSVRACSEVCRGRLRRGNPQPDLRPKCWAWDAIKQVLAEGPASTWELAQAVYGGDTERDRRAMICILYQLAGTHYRGGPWIVRVRHGEYALPGARVATPDALLAALKERPRTIDALGALFGIAPRTAQDWVQQARRRGVPVQKRMPPREQREHGRQYWYWIGARATAYATNLKAGHARTYEKRPLERVPCAGCGTEFETRNPAQRYCGSRCRAAASARRAYVGRVA